LLTHVPSYEALTRRTSLCSFRNEGVLKDGGFKFFSVRNEYDEYYKKRIENQRGIYDISFKTRFFAKTDLQDLIKSYFDLLWIKEVFEEPVTLYLINTRTTLSQ
jgi:hypothetical protein